MASDPVKRDKHLGTPFREMTRLGKAKFIAKVVVCILTLGMAFPNVMSD